MSRIECDHVKYCENCDRYYCSSCRCACSAESKITFEEAREKTAALAYEYEEKIK